MDKQNIYVVDGLRTPFLKFTGLPGPFSAADLAVQAAKALFLKVKCDPTAIDHMIVGCVMPSAEEANIARLIALRAGCGIHTPGFTVQRNCASGLQSIDSAQQAIRLGYADLIMAGGTEVMSRAPLIYPPEMAIFLAKLKQAKGFAAILKTCVSFRPAYMKPIIALLKGLTDPFVNLSMGQTAEELAFRYAISRQAMDAYALQSHQAAHAAQADLSTQIIPIYTPEGGFFDRDTGIRTDSNVEKLATLKPVFDKFGNITPANSSQISDGAAMLLIANEKAINQYQLPILGKIIDVQWSGVDPSVMGLGPIYAMNRLLTRQNLSVEDIDIIEINEAFAAQVLACQKAWERGEGGLDSHRIDDAKLNPQGGAIAIGHPVSASGARLVLQSLQALKKNKGKRALVSLCIGGGQGGAILLEAVN